MVRNAKLVGQSIISYLQKKGYPEVSFTLKRCDFKVLNKTCYLFMVQYLLILLKVFEIKVVSQKYYFNFSVRAFHSPHKGKYMYW